EYVVTRHDNQQPRMARVTAARSASPSTDNRRVDGAAPRSIHDSGRVICPPPRPAHTNTAPAPRRLTNNTANREPSNGWNGCATTTKPKSSLHDRGLCRLRRNPPRQLTATGFGN